MASSCISDIPDNIKDVIIKVRSSHAEIPNLTLKTLIKIVDESWDLDLIDFAYKENFGKHRDIATVANFIRYIDGAKLTPVPFEKNNYYVSFKRPESLSKVVSMVHLSNKKSKKKKVNGNKNYQSFNNNYQIPKLSYRNNSSSTLTTEQYKNRPFFKVREKPLYRSSLSYSFPQPVNNSQLLDGPKSSNISELSFDMKSLSIESEKPILKSKTTSSMCNFSNDAGDLFDDVFKYAVKEDVKKEKKVKKNSQYRVMVQNSNSLNKTVNNLDQVNIEEKKIDTNSSLKMVNNNIAFVQKPLSSQHYEETRKVYNENTSVDIVKNEVKLNYQTQKQKLSEDSLFDDDEDVLPTIEEVEIFLNQDKEIQKRLEKDIEILDTKNSSNYLEGVCSNFINNENLTICKSKETSNETRNLEKPSTCIKFTFTRNPLSLIQATRIH